MVQAVCQVWTPWTAHRGWSLKHSLYLWQYEILPTLVRNLEPHIVKRWTTEKFNVFEIGEVWSHHLSEYWWCNESGWDSLGYACQVQEATGVGVQGIWDWVRRTPQDAAQHQALPADIMQRGTAYRVPSRVSKKNALSPWSKKFCNRSPVLYTAVFWEKLLRMALFPPASLLTLDCR